jgi:hypothetical protein
MSSRFVCELSLGICLVSLMLNLSTQAFAQSFKKPANTIAVEELVRTVL